MRDNLVEILGWYGMAAIILAYALVSFSVISANSPAFQLLNATGALGIIAISYHKGVLQSVWLNIFWLGIAITALFTIYF